MAKSRGLEICSQSKATTKHETQDLNKGVKFLPALKIYFLDRSKVTKQ